MLKQINLYVYMWDVAYQLYVFSLTNSIIVKNSKKTVLQFISSFYIYSGKLYVENTDIVAMYM